MAIYIGRRDFIGALGGALVTLPCAAEAQQSALPVIGFLSGASPPKVPLGAFLHGLNDVGYTEGKNAAIEYQSADGQYDRLPGLAAELVRRHVSVIVTAGTGSTATLAAKAATTSIPIVFLTGSDPVRLGFVASLNRPGGNLTGVNNFVAELGSKQLELISELVPGASLIGMLVNPNNAGAELEVTQSQAAARTIQRQLRILNAGSEFDIDAAYATLTQERADALVIGNDGFFLARVDRLVALSARYAIPTGYARREYSAAGGLMSYGTSQTEAYRQVGIYAGRILKGAKPADLPVVQSTKFELVINLRTAKALGIEITATLLARADEVIE
jgi:putative ABC transport system substrate-binding protein